MINDNAKMINDKANKIRLYVTIPFDEETQETILNIQYRLMAYGGGKYPKPDQLHLTIACIRNQPAEALPKIQKAISRLTFSPFRLDFQDVRLFSLRDEDSMEATKEGSLPLAVETWWLNVKSTPELKKIYADIRHQLGEEEISIKRKYRPHVTLARRTRIGKIDVSPIMSEPFSARVQKMQLLQYKATETGSDFNILLELPANPASAT